MREFLNSKKYRAVILTIALAVAMTFGLVGCSGSKSTVSNNASKDATVTILQFSDFHGAVDNATSSKNPGMDKFAAVVKEYTQQATDEHGYIVVSGGDNYQGTAMSNLTYGKVISEMMKELNVKYSAVGNHEYDWGDEYFDTWEADADMQFLAANIIDKETGELVKYAEPYAVTESNGKKIGFIGIATPETAVTTLPENVNHLEFRDPAEVVNEYSKVLRDEEKCDAVIVLAHLAAEQAEDGTITGDCADLANAISDVDAILSGHSHNLVSGTVNEIPVLQAMNNGRGLAMLTLEFKNDEVVVSFDVRDLVPEVESLPSDETVKAIYDKYNAELQPILEEVIAEQPMDLNHDSATIDSDLGQYADKLLAELAGTQIAFTNGGGIRASLEKGDLTVGDMYTVFPFDNTLVTMDMTGAQIKDVLEHGLNPNNEVGMIQWYGLIVTMDTTKAVGERVVKLTLLDGTEVDMEATYSVATNNFLATDGDGFVFSTAANIKDTGLAFRDGMIDYLRGKGIIDFEKVTQYIEQ